ncbi:MAG TPA: GNAT family N-acetyltransferase [Phenylobacterium sp.]
MIVPTLATARLTLEPLSVAHSAGMFAMWSQAEVCCYSGPAADYEGRPIRLPAETPADSDRIIDFFVRCAADGTRFRWAARLDGAFVGAIGFNALGPCAEIAFHQRPEFWGRGLMAEAATAALAWLRTRPDAREVEAFVDPANLTSIRLTERLGMRRTGETAEGADRYLMGLAD